ncbi:MAG: cytochrome b, partial [Alphaproteobacteria bacterium]|nr:cytochrome b [Alphaproteobacteria bacterium]
MQILDSPSRYGAPAQLLHWFVVALVAVAWFTDEGMEHGGRGFGASLHVGAGALVLALSLLRLFWRAVNRAPPMPADTPAWQRRAASLAHVALYALTLAVPLSGWAARWFEGRPVSPFGLFGLPAPMAANRALAERAGDLHEVLANLLLAVVAAHVLA